MNWYFTIASAWVTVLGTLLVVFLYRSTTREQWRVALTGISFGVGIVIVAMFTVWSIVVVVNGVFSS